MKANYDDAIGVIRHLTDLGHTAYLAGGCVRDLVCGFQPHDYDVATSAVPEQVQAAFEETIPVGASFGVIKVICGDKRELDVATFRRDGNYSDNRRPDNVQFELSAEEDVKRRDFTINSMLMDADGKIIDYMGGMEDLKKRVLRTVGKPVDRFGEDALRMLRAIRFAVRFRLDIETDTWKEIQALSDTINNVSKERVTDELSRMFCYGNADIAYWMLQKSKLFRAWFGYPLDEDDNWRILNALSHVKPEDPFILSFAIIVAESWCKNTLADKLSLTNSQYKELDSLLSRQSDMREFLWFGTAKQRKMMQWEDKDLILKFLDYEKENYYFDIHYAHYQNEATFKARMKEIIAMGWPCPIVTGDDLIDMGFVPGPIFTEMLELVRDKQLEGVLTEKEVVKPYLLSTFPAAPRIENGKVVDGTVFKRVIAQCPHCKSSMSCEVPRNERGEIQWSQARNAVNMNIHASYVFAESQCCYARKKKSLFVEAVV